MAKKKKKQTEKRDRSPYWIFYWKIEEYAVLYWTRIIVRKLFKPYILIR